MKKSLFIAAITLSALCATSCTKENDVQVGGESTVILTAQLPEGIQSNGPRRKAAVYGDGKTATTLDYAVYQVTTDATAGTKTYNLISSLGKTNETINISATVTLQLINGNTYAIVFWADAPSSIYTFTAEASTATITADYTAATASAEAYDAFYALKEFTVNGAMQETVELKRPFAQLNIGTADLTAATTAGVTVAKAGIKVNTYKTLDLTSGEVSDPADVEFALAALPTGETFPVTGYDYLTMNYLLMPVDKKADNNITISYDNAAAGTRTFNNVPLQRNYRTNIYGNLLTSSTTFNVVITPGFNDDDITYWDGTSTSEPQKDATTGAYIITKAAEWAWLGGKKIDNSIILANDIDFGGYSIKAISIGEGGAARPDWVCDGQNHTLSNVTIAETSSTDYASALFVEGLFTSSMVIKDLTVKNIKVDRPFTDNGYAAAILANCPCNNAVTITNVHVDNATIKGVQGVGGILGIKPSVGTVAISNCSVKNSNFSNYSIADESGYVASIVGRVVSNVTITDCQVENNTINAFFCTKRGEASIDAIAGVDSAKGGSLTKDNVTGETTVTINKTAI